MKEKDKPTLARFWIAGESIESARVGTLEYNRSGAIIILAGFLNGIKQVTDETICGITNETGKKFSLYNCFTMSCSIDHDGEIVHSTIESTKVIFGTHDASPKYFGIQFRIPQISNLLSKINFDQNIKDQNKFAVEFNTYEEEKLKLSEELDLIIVEAAHINENNKDRQAFHIELKLYLRILSNQKIADDLLTNQVRHLRRFFEFVCHAKLEQVDTSLIEDPEKAWETNEIHLSRIYKKDNEKIDRDKILFEKDDLALKLHYLLLNWFELKKTHREPIDRYFDALESQNSNPILTFLWIVSAIEELHKIRAGRNGFSFEGRLTQVCNRWSEAIHKPNIEKHLTIIKDTRHYYAHGAGDLRNKSAHDWELIRYNCFLVALYNLEILSLLGNTDEDVIKIANKKYWMKNYLSMLVFAGDQ